ncbi:MAG TPA: hypothetical protein DCE47_15555 [Planctomycetaceae bacterium]|nr:hypothetical protein [Planctomycetaceae bacterium]
MIGRSLVRVLGTAMVVTLTLLSVEKASAQRNDGAPVIAPIAGPVRVRAVDDKKTDDWPAGPWKAIPRQDYFDLVGEITRLRSRPRAAWIQTAEYSARIDDTQLRDGQLSLELINNAPGPTAIPLAPLGLAITSLQLDGRPLTWGTTAHRTVVLVAPPGRSTVTGHWSLQGRKVVSLEEFDVRLAPSVQTSLVLDVPSSHRLTASNGQLTQPTNGSTRPVPVGHHRFRLQLGHRNRSRLIIDHTTAATPSTTTRLLARQRTSCEIAVNGARIVTDLVFERTGQAVQDLVLSVPAGARVESISYDGDPVVARPINPSPGASWRVTLPDPLPHAADGTSRTLQVTIDSDILADQSWKLPEVSVVGAQPLGSDPENSQPDLTLNVREPLELKTFRSVGWKQTADAVGGRRFTFARIGARTSLELVVGQPRRALSADVLARLDRDQAGWTASAEIAWSSTSGASFSTRALLAPGWNIVDLQPVDPATRVEWRTIAVAGNRQQLIVEWSDAVDTTSTRPLMIQLSRAGNELDVGDLPLVEPLECDRHRMILAAAVPLAGTRLEDSVAGVLEPIRPENLGDPWPAFASFDALTESAPGGLFRWSPPSATIPTNRTGPGESADGTGTVTTSQSPIRRPAGPDFNATENIPARPQTMARDAATDVGRIISMLVLSQLAPVDAGHDHHSAHMRFVGDIFDRPFRFRLPSEAHLEAVLVNGQAARAESDGTEISVPPLELGALRTIEVRYTTPATTSFLVSRRVIPFPQLETNVTFTWDVTTAPGQILTGAPGRSILASQSSEEHWTTRWLGPVGRGPHHGIFNPLSASAWRRIFGGGHLEPSRSGSRRGFGWNSQRSTFTSPPVELSVSVVRHDRLSALSWLMLAVALVIGIRYRLSVRRPNIRWTAGGLAALVLLGWWTPAPWTLLTGAILAAIWLLLLMPPSLWNRQSTERLASPTADVDAFEEGSLGSTRSYRGIPTGLGLLLACAGLTHTMAQEPPPATPPPAQPPTAARPDVLLPVDASGRPSPVTPFAFVRPDLLETLFAERRANKTDSGVLLRRADYSATIRANGKIGLTAAFEAVVTGRNDTVQIRLPVDGVNLAPDACRVNGRRHPLARENGGGVLLLNLPPRTTDTPRIDRVELDLRPTVKPSSGGGRIDLAIPRILAGRLKLVLPANPPKVEMPSTIGTDPANGDFLLGASQRLQLSWTADPTVTTPRPRSIATTAPLCLVRIHPLETRLEYRLPVSVRGGNLNVLTLSLPGQLVFRPGDIAAPDVLAIRSLPPDGGRQLVIIEFVNPQTDTFEIRLSGRLPVSADAGRLAIDPAITLAHGAPPIPVVADPMKMGVNPANGFQLAVVAPPPEGVAAMDVVEFTRVWQNDQDSSQPVASFAWTLEKAAVLPLDVLPLRPRRVVRVEQFLHVREDRLELTITASAKTTGLSVFHHSLKIDPRLKITSIGIQQQDGADRLARTARVGDQLVLYLKDANLFEEETQTGIQNITIQGELPLDVTKRVALPEVVFTDAETSSTTLSLYHDPQLAVTLTGAELVSPAEDAAPSTTSAVDAREVLAGRFVLSTDKARAKLDIRRKKLPTPLQLLFQLQPNPDGPWRLRVRTMPLPGPHPSGPLLVTVESALLAVNGTDAPIQWQPTPDSVTVDDGRLGADFENVAEVTFETTLPDTPDSDRWTPPLPLVSGRPIRQRLLILPSEITWIPEGDISRLDSWPDDLSRDKLGVDDLATIWRLTGPNWRLSRRTEPPINASLSSKPPINTPPPSRGARPIERPTEVTGSPSGWWITWRILVSLALAGAIAWGWPLLERSRLKAWLRQHDSFAWLLIGISWWLAGLAGAVGLGLATAMATVLLLRSRSNRRRSLARSEG